jgi:hypothetical protein
VYSNLLPRYWVHFGCLLNVFLERFQASLGRNSPLAFRPRPNFVSLLRHRTSNVCFSGIKCDDLSDFAQTDQETLCMELKLYQYLSTLSSSLAWFPRPSFRFRLDGSQDPAISESLAAPGSLRDAHNAACAWFLGPKAENADYFKKYVETILNDVVQCRRNFSPEDEVCFCFSPS